MPLQISGQDFKVSYHLHGNSNWKFIIMEDNWLTEYDHWPLIDTFMKATEKQLVKY